MVSMMAPLSGKLMDKHGVLVMAMMMERIWVDYWVCNLEYKPADVLAANLENIPD